MIPYFVRKKRYDHAIKFNTIVQGFLQRISRLSDESTPVRTVYAYMIFSTLPSTNWRVWESKLRPKA